MQDFFCPRCGKRIMNGKCDCSRVQSGPRSKPAVRSFGQEQNLPGLSVESGSKVIPFESIKTEDTGNTTRKKNNNKESVIITLIDLEQEKIKNAERLKAKRKAGISDRLKTGLSRFSALVDQLVNPEEE